MNIWEDHPLARQFWNAGHADIPIYDMHGHMGNLNTIHFARAEAGQMVAHMKRIGVRTLRHGDNRVTAKYGILCLDHASVLPKDSPEKVSKRIAEMIRRAAERQNPAIEFCNEWNMNRKDTMYR